MCGQSDRPGAEVHRLGAAAPTLSKLGGTRWAKTKERWRIGRRLSGRAATYSGPAFEPAGHRYPDDTPGRRSSRAVYLHETEDQLAAQAEIKRDMRKTTPMDRLLCGDVGYARPSWRCGRRSRRRSTASRWRCWFPRRCWPSSTNALPRAHRGLPVRGRELSRFKTDKQQREILEGPQGQVDILIGTHDC
jgi:transcription-repair coupling factor (superfamily II helicase)